MPPLCCNQQHCSCHPSRPGPVFGTGNGVIQNLFSGEYSRSADIDACPDVSPSFSQQLSMTSQHGCSSDPPEVHPPVQLIPPNSSLKPLSVKLSVYYQNERGLKSKIDEFFLACSELEFDIIILIETWLDDSVTFVQLFGDEYHVYAVNRGYSGYWFQNSI